VSVLKQNWRVIALICTLLLGCIKPSTIAYGIEIKSSEGQAVMLSETLRSSDANGQGTHTNFRDPQESGRFHTVVNFAHKTNRWVRIEYHYYAHGFNATFAENDNINAGVIAMAGLSYSQASWDGQKSGYVYDTVTARSNIMFEFMLTTTKQHADVKKIPVSIGINIMMEVMAISEDDYARSEAFIELFQDSKLLRQFWFKRIASEGKEPVSTPITKEDMDKQRARSGETTVMFDENHEKVYFHFTELQLEPGKVYSLRLTGSASTNGNFKPDDETGGATASIVIDPSIHVSPEFPYPDDYYVLVSPDLIDESLAEPKIALSMTQNGEEVTQIDVNGGLVTIVAPTSLGQNITTTYFWSAIDSNFNDLDEKLFDNNYTFDPGELQPGSYTVHLGTFPPLNPSKGSINFNVVSGSQQGPETTGGIPGFPLNAMVLGLFSIIYLFYRQSRKQ
jgi:hypothetical protein